MRSSGAFSTVLKLSNAEDMFMSLFRLIAWKLSKASSAALLLNPTQL
ncbi:hypothetical protein Gotri_003253 [Gossypium trilobum]|uniref:Uncharacterized protein n=2 Tax=Gossypium TaxID=3633 RepID=A0A7J9F1D9_9ROSI|nr:hypothetical protein [Gossypium davidsonii]MBA0778968.1 hypothetical protein [Gossypium trilobum]